MGRRGEVHVRACILHRLRKGEVDCVVYADEGLLAKFLQSLNVGLGPGRTRDFAAVVPWQVGGDGGP